MYSVSDLVISAQKIHLIPFLDSFFNQSDSSSVMCVKRFVLENLVLPLVEGKGIYNGARFYINSGNVFF